MKHLLAEKPFFSLQGEGMWSGKPSVFVRYAGCNLRCQFGLKCKNENNKREVPSYIQEVIDKLDEYNDVQDLPVFPTYCDTYIGILSEFAKFWVTYETTEALAEEVYNLIKDNPNKHNIDIVFTGGEPMMQQERLLDLLNVLSEKYHWVPDITIETNGTMPIKPELKDEWNKIHNFKNEITFSISPKISSANYTFEETCKGNVPKEYQDVASYVFLKYVVKDEEDIPLVQRYNKEYLHYDFEPDGIFLMPCGGKADPDFDKTQVTVFDLCIKYGYSFSPRLQMIKKNAWAV